MSLVNYIPENEMAMIKNYRNFYGDGDIAYCDTRPMEDILEQWASKKEFLYEVFNKNFIISDEINIAKSETEMIRKLSDMLRGGKDTPIKSFWNDWREKCVYLYRNGTFNRDNYYNLLSLFNEHMLLNNKNDYVIDTIPLSNGKSLSITPGDKVLRIIGKVAASYEIEGFEEFRIEHSKFLNDKYMKGTLCLSIHPLDYMTMSDNGCNWSSCMSWKEGGCYRQGTVEMMNSPSVVVAYLESSEKMNIGQNQWNSKKWRELFIVTEGFIAGIKGYPYQHSELEEIIINKLRDLLTKYDSELKFKDEIGYYKNRSIYNHDDTILKSNFYFETHEMYNDFGSRNKHPILISETHTFNSEYNYSGPTQCMNCGSVYPTVNYGDDHILVCCDESRYICENCGAGLYEDEVYYDNEGYGYCEDCFYERFVTDVASNLIEVETAVEVYVVNTNFDVTKQIEDGIARSIYLPETIYRSNGYDDYINIGWTPDKRYYYINDICDSVIIDGREEFYIDINECTNTLFRNAFGYYSYAESTGPKEAYNNAIKRYFEN